MTKFIALRVAAMVPLLVVISILAFLLVQLAPGTVADSILGSGATPQAVADLNHRLGLDRPLITQYGIWVGNALQGDLGVSAKTAEPVAGTIGSRMGATLSLTLGALVLAVVVGIGLGVRASLRPGGIFDRTITILSSAALAVPSFWVGILLSVYVGVKWGVLPAGGYTEFAYSPIDWLKGLILPWLALALPSAAVIARQMRSAMVDVLRSGYVRAAVAGGLTRRQVVWRHALKNALTPVIPVIGFQLVVILGASFVVEQAFNIPGVGSMAVQAIFDRDLSLVQGTVIVVAVFVLLSNLMTDIVFGWANPKVRL
ncbi:ABC transporter permease [Nocardioides sp. LMS-CY]|uniref:ABC transporter permease n=1 Tax=Nocardioides sp. (strain LMS-CY) TaxID=2840457 RepID=UPI001C005658|nr:ABC transporter permease [Nocardioides sp. LMS-CY]QWF21282.1 ABC transporter permease [Nocardioides sp. LMS-CY]